nr:hypothetical protein [Pasteurella multocida]
MKSISRLQRNYQFSGRLGTISAVPHTTSEMTLAKASDEPLEMCQIACGVSRVTISMAKVQQDINQAPM